MGKKNKYNNYYDNSEGNFISGGEFNNNVFNGVVNNKTHNDNRKYNYTTVYNIVSSIPDKDDNFRSMLSGIEHETESPVHIFTGFINRIDLKLKKIVICNVFWNKDVYVCNHINVMLGKYMFKDIDFDNLDLKNIDTRKVNLSLPGDIEDLKIGDFIVFKALIYSYGYKNSVGRYNKTLRLQKVIDVVRKPEILIPCRIPQYANNGFDGDLINDMSIDLIQRYYDIQINRIRLSLEHTKYYNSAMYESILQHILYKGTKEHSMIKNQLRIDADDFNNDLTVGVSLLRYLVTEFDITHSPYIVFTYMNVLMRYNNPNKKDSYYERTVRRYSEKGLYAYGDNHIRWLTTQAYNAYMHYMREFTDIIMHGESNLFLEHKKLDK